jgi:small GTP-binding protein
MVPEQTAGFRDRLQPLFARLAEDRFNLVVVGRFNRGKTSLMNAILATDRLPTGIVPLTSVITAVAYGSKERLLLRFRNSVLDREVSIDALPQHVTQQGNPGNVQRIASAEIQLPAEILRRGFYFVDTPGLGSVIAENTLTTETFLPEADAFVLVTSYESPLSEEEVQFFKAASAWGKRIFVVLNKQDTVSPEQREAVRNFVQEQLKFFFDRAQPGIFSVSSTDGLRAKLSGNDPTLAPSGIPELKSRLIKINEKREQFLLGMCDRVRDLLRELPRSAETATLTLRVGALRKELGKEHQHQALDTASVRVAASLHNIQACEICARIADEVWDLICQYQYEIAVSHEEQQRFATRGGLCPFHTWQLQGVASPYGLCAGYSHLLEHLATKLHDAGSEAVVRDLRAKVQSLIPSEESCILCSVRRQEEQDAVAATAKQFHKGRAFNSMSALCLPHFSMLLSAIRDSELVRSLLERQAAVLQRYSEDVRRYAIKHDAVRRYLASQEETTVAERGLLLVAGFRQVNFAPGPSAEPTSDHGDTGKDKAMTI